MAVNSAGIFSLLYDWVADKVANIKIRSDRMMAQEQDIADAINLQVDRAGKKTMQNSLNMRINKIINLATGTTSIEPLQYFAGTLLTSAIAGGEEYDGVAKYFTGNTTSGRGYIPTTQIFRLTANGSAIGATINNFFGANSAINLAAGGVYEIEAYCYFTKTTAGTVTVTATTSLAPVNLNGTINYGAITGGTATGAANQISLYNSTATGAAFGASGSLTTAVNHAFIIRLIVEANASASNLRINFTESAGTVTPLRGSYYKATLLPAGNTGLLAA